MYHTVSSKLVYQSKWLKLYEDLVENRRGGISKFNRITFHNFVEIVPILNDGSILMIKIYRYGAKKDLLELPAGYIEDNETPMKSAKRELLEETGYSCRSMKAKGWYYYIPSRSKQKVYVFVARGLKLISSLQLDEFENISVVKLSKKQIQRKMRSGQIKNSSVIAALMLAGF